MIIWQSWGIVIAIITFLSLLITEYTVENSLGNESYYQTHGWPKLLGFFIAAFIAFIINKIFNKNKDRVVIDKETRKEFILNNSPTLFFINIKYWPILLMCLGVLFYFVND